MFLFILVCRFIPWNIDMRLWITMYLLLF